MENDFTISSGRGKEKKVENTFISSESPTSTRFIYLVANDVKSFPFSSLNLSRVLMTVQLQSNLKFYYVVVKLQALAPLVLVVALHK